ncbi:MAG: 30S ribosome-binding factor RbfA [Ruminococcus sp.]|nr:30S ribosome-binding factor RbfA [Ruminococcus sp.]
MGSHKAGRMSEDIKRIVSGMMRELKDPRLHGGTMLTVVRCDVANDGSFCKVYISSFEGFDSAKEAVKGLNSAKGLIKREVSKVLGMKKCPELSFVADNSIERSAEITRRLKTLVPEQQAEDREEQQTDGE